jgi:CubicO group peptidase (beta-lactamase class C family)
VGERASGYARRDGQLENARTMDMRVLFAAGGLYSTVDDLLRWNTALHGGALLDGAHHRQMVRAHANTSTPGEQHGYGVFLVPRAAPGRPQGAPMVLSHDGRTDGFVASVQFDPASAASVIVLCNENDLAIASIVDELWGIVSPPA